MRKLSVIFVALALVVGFSVNAMAAQALFYSEKERLTTAPTKELEVYGSVRVGTYWITGDKESNNPTGGLGTRTTGQNFDDADLLWELDDSSTRFGVRFKSGKIGANVEIRPRDQQAASYSGSTSLMRHWYGTYDMGFGTLIVGQTWTPTFNPICNECLLGGGGFLDGYGDFGGSARKPGLQLHMPIKSINGLMKLALLEPSNRKKPDAASVMGLPVPLTTPAVTAANPNPYLGQGAMNPPAQAAVPANWTDYDTTLPALEGSISAAFGPTSWTFIAGYNTYDVKNDATDQTQSIDAYVLKLDGTYSMGPFYVRGGFYWGQNLAAFGSQAPNTNQTFGFSPALYTVGTGVNVQDTTNWGWMAVAGFKVNDMLSLEVAYGERHAEQDSIFGGTNEDTHSGITFFAPISITPAFVITPELLIANNKDLQIVNAAGVAQTVDRGSQMAFGIYWRIDF